jgi:hypothetical protein
MVSLPVSGLNGVIFVFDMCPFYSHVFISCTTKELRRAKEKKYFQTIHKTYFPTVQTFKLCY